MVGYDIRSDFRHGLLRGLTQVPQLDVGLIREPCGKVCWTWLVVGTHCVNVFRSRSIDVATVVS